LRIKEQETHLTLQEHDDDDDGNSYTSGCYTELVHYMHHHVVAYVRLLTFLKVFVHLELLEMLL